MKVTVEAPAKVNLTLDIRGRRPDGYHEVETVMQAVDLCDTLTVDTTPSGITLDVGGAPLPADGSNTVVAATNAFFRRLGQVPFGVHIALQKRIPMQAGMAGGSADAAGVLVGLNALCGTPFTTERLCHIGAEVGADVPFCVRGGAALATGTGTDLQPLPPLSAGCFVAVKPLVSVSTAAAYKAVDSATLTRRPDTAAMVAAVETGNLSAVGAGMVNVFEEALALPEVAVLVSTLAVYKPLGCLMTGSGSVVCALFPEETAAVPAVDALRRAGEQVFLCHPMASGPRVL